MKVEQIYTGCLSQGAYFIESNGEAAVIDPLRDTADYLRLSEEANATIKYVFETHFHADFISGHLTLANQTGAQIVYGPKADPSFDAIVAKDQQVFKIGNVTLTVIHTPGHTLESTSYLLKDESGKEHCIFTGDTLFLGDVGIPDVAQRYMGVSKEELAGILYDSVNNRIKPLNDDILVYPGHGAGSACGKNMMKETVDTLSNQKVINYALNGSFDKESFVKELTDELPEPPQYFPSNVKLNQQGYLDLEEILSKSLISLSVIDFKSLADQENTVILDVRSQDEFRQGFIPSSIFIGLTGGFAPWVGSVLKDVNTKILLVCSPGKEEEAIVRLSRVGFDRTIGYLKGGFEAWKEADCDINIIESIDADGLAELLSDESISLIDVRACGERKNGFLPVSSSFPLNVIHNHLDEIDSSKKHYVHCAGGYRSMIACSIMKRNGYDDLVDVAGGYSSISKHPTIEVETS
jgi:glyoxylase-like metal-dependent hydrolase (beta-lactamase superfamily II)/rhodanese-related sulfurtransferase